MIKALAAATVLAAASAGAASAATLGGTFTIDIYNYESGGVEANADASVANVVANAGNLVTTVTYTGLLDFFTDTGGGPSIMEFLLSAGGSYVDAGMADLGILMSSTGFNTTTLLDIKGMFETAVEGTILHDDGVTLIAANGVVIDQPTPVPATEHSFFATAGGFRLIYSAANGNPEVLNVDVSAVPVPAAGLMLLAGLGGLAAIRRRRAA